MSDSRTAMAQMLGSRFLTLLATGAGLAVLGRLLTPDAFGQFAIAMAAFQVMKSVSNFGLRQFLIRSETDPDDGMLSSAIGVSLALSLLGCLLLWGAAWIGAVFLPAGLSLVFLPIGLALLPGPLALASEATLHRNLSFRRPAWAALASTLADLAIAIALAWAGFGPVALATGVLASEVIGCLVLRGFKPTRGRIPRPRLGLSDFAAFGGFGGRLTVINVAPNLVSLGLVSALGGLAGVGATGLYNRARTIVELLDRVVLEGISPVVLPVISDALRGGVPLRQVLATKLDYMTVLCWPALGGVALLAEPMVRLLLGAQWTAAAPAVQLLAISGFVLPVVKLSVKMFTALDKLDAYLRIQLVTQILALGLGVLGAAVSLEMFCAAISLAALIKGAWIWIWLHRHAGREGDAAWRAAGRGAIVTIGTLCPPAALLVWGDLGPTALLVTAIASAIFVWIALLTLTRHPLMRDLLAVMSDARRLGRG